MHRWPTRLTSKLAPLKLESTLPMSNTLLTQHANTSIWSCLFTPLWHTYRFQQQSHLIEMLMILVMKICFVWPNLAPSAMVPVSLVDVGWPKKKERKSNRTSKIKFRRRKQTQNNNVCFNFAGTTWNFIGFFFFLHSWWIQKQKTATKPRGPP